MNCPTCGHEDSSVIRTETDDGTVERRRQCAQCGYRWSTVEVPAKVWKQHKAIIKLARGIAAIENDPKSVFSDSETGRITITID